MNKQPGEQIRSKPEATRLFVYGTLKRGHERAWALVGQRFVSEAATRSEFLLFDCGGFPGLVLGGQTSVHGELWEVDADCLKRLDEIEGVAEGWYARRPVSLRAPHEADVVDAYFFLGDTDQLGDCGDRW